MDWIKTEDALPIAESLVDDECSEYYLIKIIGWAGTQQAMYLYDDKGNKNWYTSYVSMIIKEVDSWCKIL